MILLTTGKIQHLCLQNIFKLLPFILYYSAESGFSDERGDDTDEEDNAVEGRIRLGPRRRPRKVKRNQSVI